MTAQSPTEAPSGAIDIPWFIGYKFLNSLFLGLSIGSVFVLYAPISPSVFSAGGIGLALGTLLIATQYQRLFSLRWFYGLSLVVELVVLAGVFAVLMFPLQLAVALFVYIGYQFTFAFGSYLVRCETLMIADKHRLTQLDIAKQSGYLVGMAASWGIYTGMEQALGLTDQTRQVIAIHWPLLTTEILVILALVRAFKTRPTSSN